MRDGKKKKKKKKKNLVKKKRGTTNAFPVNKSAESEMNSRVIQFEDGRSFNGENSELAANSAAKERNRSKDPRKTSEERRLAYDYHPSLSLSLSFCFSPLSRVYKRCALSNFTRLSRCRSPPPRRTTM